MASGIYLRSFWAVLRLASGFFDSIFEALRPKFSCWCVLFVLAMGVWRESRSSNLGSRRKARQENRAKSVFI